MSEKPFLYFALGVMTVVSVGAVTNQIMPLASGSGVAISDGGIGFPDGSFQTTAAAPDLGRVLVPAAAFSPAGRHDSGVFPQFENYMGRWFVTGWGGASYWASGGLLASLVLPANASITGFSCFVKDNEGNVDMTGAAWLYRTYLNEANPGYAVHVGTVDLATSDATQGLQEKPSPTILAPAVPAGEHAFYIVAAFGFEPGQEADAGFYGCSVTYDPPIYGG